MSVTYGQAFFRSQWRFIPPTLVGFAIGWCTDVSAVVEGPSMIPTLEPKDRVWFLPVAILSPMHKCFPGFFSSEFMVREGDVVVVRINQKLSVCKRVTRITSSCEERESWESACFSSVDEHYRYFHHGERHSEENQPPPSPPTKPLRSLAWESSREAAREPTAWMWLEGDNQINSMDSRHCGAVPLECLRGRVVATFYPKPRLIYNKSITSTG